MTAYSPTPADPTDVVGRRIGAYAIDIALASIILLAFMIPIYNGAARTVSGDDYRCFNSPEQRVDDPRERIDSDICFEFGNELSYIPQSEAGTFSLQFYGLLALIGVLNLVLLQGLTGASIGKLLVGLRVVRQDGKVANVGWALIRWVLLFVDAFCCFMPGAILLFTTKGHRRLGDMAASTFVVDKSQVGQPALVPGVTVPEYPTAGGYGPPAGGGWPQPGAPSGTGWPTPPDPSSSTWGPPTGADPTVAAPTGDGPTWDDARNTYIQYDRPNEKWVQWDAASSEWRPIDE